MKPCYQKRAGSRLISLCKAISVPFLVASDQLNYTMMGYNVIEKITKQSTDSTVKDSFVDSVSANLSTTSQDNVKTLVSFIQAFTSTNFSFVKTGRIA